jgi:hypothetical protein
MFTKKQVAIPVPTLRVPDGGVGRQLRPTRAGAALRQVPLVLSIAVIIVVRRDQLQLRCRRWIALIVASAFRLVVRLLEKHMLRVKMPLSRCFAGVLVRSRPVTIAVVQVQSQFATIPRSR